MSDSSRSKARPRGSAASSAAGHRPTHDQGSTYSIPRTVVAGLVTLLGIAWIAVYINIAQDGQQLTWMGDLGRWNFLIGFGLLFLGLALFANPGTPLGRGRGVVVGMLGCFLLGLVWIVVYYLAGQPTEIPVFRNLDAYNLIVGIGFMAVGFVYATRWE
ncbi:MAG TPA: cell division protein CrgA [Nocardioidaceae bacterium]|nr:cell division protein CrgA [Nocardioidaceae bacterium]